MCWLGKLIIFPFRILYAIVSAEKMKETDMAHLRLYEGKLFRMDQKFLTVKAIHPDPRCMTDEFAILSDMRRKMSNLGRITCVPDSIIATMDFPIDEYRAVSAQHIANLLLFAGEHDASVRLEHLIGTFFERVAKAVTGPELHCLIVLSRDEFSDVS